jgi:hypothetical protein
MLVCLLLSRLVTCLHLLQILSGLMDHEWELRMGTLYTLMLGTGLLYFLFQMFPVPR